MQSGPFCALRRQVWSAEDRLRSPCQQDEGEMAILHACTTRWKENWLVWLRFGSLRWEGKTVEESEMGPTYIIDAIFDISLLYMWLYSYGTHKTYIHVCIYIYINIYIYIVFSFFQILSRVYMTISFPTNNWECASYRAATGPIVWAAWEYMQGCALVDLLHKRFVTFFRVETLLSCPWLLNHLHSFLAFLSR